MCNDDITVSPADGAKSLLLPSPQPPILWRCIVIQPAAHDSGIPAPLGPAYSDQRSPRHSSVRYRCARVVRSTLSAEPCARVLSVRVRSVHVIYIIALPPVCVLHKRLFFTENKTFLLVFFLYIIYCYYSTIITRGPNNVRFFRLRSARTPISVRRCTPTRRFIINSFNAVFSTCVFNRRTFNV